MISSIRPRTLSVWNAASKTGYVAPLAVTEARQHRLAVEHHGGIGGEDEVRQARHRIERVELGAKPFDDAA